MLKALIIDDETRASDALKLMIEKFTPQVKQVSVCNDSRIAAEVIRTIQPHIIFLDIKMPHVSGFDLLQSLANQDFKVIFTTAYNEFAIKAIRFSAFDYLLKPVDVEELVTCIDRYFDSQKRSSTYGMMFENMIHNIQSIDQNFRLALPSRDGVHFLEPVNIIYCEALSNYTRFHTAEGRQYLASRTLGDYEELLLPYGFIRCHKSSLVNKKFVSYVDHDGFIVMKNGIKLEISKRRKAEVIKGLV